MRIEPLGLNREDFERLHPVLGYVAHAAADEMIVRTGECVKRGHCGKHDDLTIGIMTSAMLLIAMSRLASERYRHPITPADIIQRVNELNTDYMERKGK